MKALIAVIALATMLAGLTAALASDYPSRPITIIVPFAAGGPSDVMARILADRMKTTLGQTVLVENVTGASGSIGVTRAHMPGNASPSQRCMGCGASARQHSQPPMPSYIGATTERLGGSGRKPSPRCAPIWLP
jgi:hypothetical protein